MAEKKLKSSQRENKRYLLLETEAGRKEIESCILDFLGVLGMAKTGISFISTEKNGKPIFSVSQTPTKNTQGVRDNKIIAVNREEVDRVRAALTLSSKLIKVKKVSGTLKKLKN